MFEASQPSAPSAHPSVSAATVPLAFGAAFDTHSPAIGKTPTLLRCVTEPVPGVKCHVRRTASILCRSYPARFTRLNQTNEILRIEDGSNPLSPRPHSLPFAFHTGRSAHLALPSVRRIHRTNGRRDHITGAIRSPGSAPGVPRRIAVTDVRNTRNSLDNALRSANFHLLMGISLARYRPRSSPHLSFVACLPQGGVGRTHATVTHGCRA